MTDDELQRLLVLDAGPGPALAIDAAHTEAIIDAALAGAGFGPGGGSGGSGSAGTSGGAAVGTKLAIVGSAALVVVAIALLAGRGRHRADDHVVASINSPSAASNTPAFASSSLYFPISVRSFSSGSTPASEFLSALTRTEPGVGPLSACTT